jgi:hypothetical protein
MTKINESPPIPDIKETWFFTAIMMLGSLRLRIWGMFWLFFFFLDVTPNSTFKLLENDNQNKLFWVIFIV